MAALQSVPKVAVAPIIVVWLGFGIGSKVLIICLLTFFPVLVTSMFWKDMTTRGAVVGGFLGLITAVLGVVLSPAVWEGIFGNPKGSALVTLDNPTLVSMTLAFAGIYLVSKFDSSKRAAVDRAGFAEQYVRSQTGIGATGAASH